MQTYANDTPPLAPVVPLGTEFSTSGDISSPRHRVATLAHTTAFINPSVLTTPENSQQTWPTPIKQQGRASTATTNTAPSTDTGSGLKGGGQDPQFQLRQRGGEGLSKGSGSKAPHSCSHSHFCSTAQHLDKVQG